TSDRDRQRKGTIVGKSLAERPQRRCAPACQRDAATEQHRGTRTERETRVAACRPHIVGGTCYPPCQRSKRDQVACDRTVPTPSRKGGNQPKADERPVNSRELLNARAAPQA